MNTDIQSPAGLVSPESAPENAKGNIHRGYNTARNRLTPLAAKRICEPGLYHDGGGLYLQVSVSANSRALNEATVNKSWVYRYRLHGKLRGMGLGSFKDFSLAEARERATKLRQLVADKIDPIDERLSRAKAIEAQRSIEISFKECAERYYAQEAPYWKNAKHSAQWINTLKAHAFPIIGKLKVHQVGKSELNKVLEPIWSSKPETASRLKQRLRAVLDWAAAKDLYPNYSHDMWRDIKKGLGPNRRGERVHHSACPHRDVAKVIKCMKESDSQAIVKFAFEFTVLTAARSGESRLMTWAEVNWDEKVWVIPGSRMKAGKEHRIPLSTRCVELLTEAQKLTGDQPFVFCHSKNGKSFSDAVFTSLLHKGLGLPYTMHGFRSTFRDWGTDKTNHPRELLEVALAHLPGNQTEHAYWRGDALERRVTIMEDWALFVGGSKEPF